MAGKKGIRGGPRPGSGRKSKAEELGLHALLHEVMGDAGKKRLIVQILKQANGGSFPHQQMMMFYIYGKPADTLKIGNDTTSGPMKIQIAPLRFVKGGVKK